MAKIIHQPHDKFFRQAMSDLQVAREFLAHELPSTFLKYMDWTTLTLEKNTYIDDELKGSAADLVYSVQVARQTAYIYILCEHQSQPDYWMALRLVNYMLRIMEQHRRQHPSAPLPLVYPLVVYSGQTHWNSPRDFLSLFGDQQSLARELLFGPYALIDIQRREDDMLKQQQFSGLVQFALKYQQVRDLAYYLDILFPWLDELDHMHDDFLVKTVLYYLVSGIEAEDDQLFVQKAQSLLSEKLKGEAMTLAQRFEQKGRQEGWQQGRQEGMILIAKKLLAKHVSMQEIHELTGLSLANIQQLHAEQEQF